MSHHIYTTRAFVLGSRASGEANRSFTLFTDELGLVQASAQGVRLEKSKLRYSLQPYRHLLVSLVRGREVWRVVGAEELMDLPLAHFELPEREFVVKIFRFLEQFIHGEGKIGNLFSDLEVAFILLPDLQNPEGCRTLEVLLMTRFLYYLGYLEARPEIAPYLEPDLKAEWLESFASVQTEALRLVDQAVLGSQL